MLLVERLDPRRHDRDVFSCGEPSLDIYLREQAAQHMKAGVSTTHVLVRSSAARTVLGYYSLSAAQLQLDDLQEADRKRLPRYPVPAVRMGRLAVSKTEHGKSHGAFLLADAVDRCLGLRAELGVRVLVVDALNENAANFYRAFGFRDAGATAGALYLPLGQA